MTVGPADRKTGRATESGLSPRIIDIMNVNRVRLHRWLSLFLVLAALALGAYMALRLRLLRLATPKVESATLSAPSWPAEAPVIPAEAWRVLKEDRARPASSTGPAAERYRLAGTFFVFAPDDPSAPRRAILDHLKTGAQLLVGEGDLVDEFEVVRVLEDRVVLRSGRLDTELRLSFSDTVAGASSATGELAVAEGIATDGETLLDHSRFGGRVGYNRWVFKRDALMGYYQELLDDPERIAALFVSLKPNYQEDQIAGYELAPVGERSFFDAIGLKEGDVIRKVNSMNMTSQKRAEYFIGEFVQNRLNAFVLDIEREGKPEKLIYLLR